jgi:hypothetical protein
MHQQDDQRHQGYTQLKNKIKREKTRPCCLITRISNTNHHLRQQPDYERASPKTTPHVVFINAQALSLLLIEDLRFSSTWHDEPDVCKWELNRLLCSMNLWLSRHHPPLLLQLQLLPLTWSEGTLLRHRRHMAVLARERATQARNISCGPKV